MPKARKPAPKRKAKAKGKAGASSAKARGGKAPTAPRGAFFQPADDMLPRIGRPSFKPTETDRRYIRTVAGLGMTHDEMASILRIDRNTLAKHFRTDIDEGRIEAMTQVAGSLFKKATDSKVTGASVRAAEIFLKRDARWLEARRPKDEDDEAGDNEMVIKGGLPEIDLKELPAEGDAPGAPPAPDKPAG